MAGSAFASEICAYYLAAMDARHPGLLVGLYLVGSIALDDFQPERSDIDFVAVTTRPVGLDEVAPIHAALAATHPHPFFDGLYVTADELRAVPDGTTQGVAVIEGLPVADSHAERHAVTWLTLARYGIARHGPRPADLGIAVDIAAAQAYSRLNLTRYWRPWIAPHRRLLSRGGAHGLTAGVVVWSVLGVSRLHAMVATGSVVSKTAAGVYARDLFPRHRAIVDCALALRGGERAPFLGGPLLRRHAMVAYLDDAIADALAQPES